jgi:hypothetical protein
MRLGWDIRIGDQKADARRVANVVSPEEPGKSVGQLIVLHAFRIDKVWQAAATRKVEHQVELGGPR